MPKYYILEFYIKNFLFSLLALVAIAMIVSFIFDYSHNLYLKYSVSLCIAIIGTIIIGYSNAASNKKEKEGQPLFLQLGVYLYARAKGLRNNYE